MDLNSIIDRVLTVDLKRGRGIATSIRALEIMDLCRAAREVFLAQPPILEISTPVKVCGDTHGQFFDLLRIFGRGGFPPETNYLFLGDYVDRGQESLEVIVLLFAYKLKYPQNFFLLRGNHECSAINRVYGFFDECRRRYREDGIRIWRAFQQVFNNMPLCALVQQRIFCVHGGLSPHLQSWDQLRRIRRPVNPDEQGLVMDLLWSDPNKWIKGWKGSSRGTSYVFGPDVVSEFCRQMKVELVARAHQVVTDGYEFSVGRRLVTIFSASNYCGEFDNAAATMYVDKSLMCSFEIYRPPKKKKVRVTQRG